MSEIVLFGVGAAIIVDYEETCGRLGIRIVAGIQNREGEVFLTDRSCLRSVDGLNRDITRVPCLCPIFTPAQRKTAVEEATSLGFSIAPVLVDPSSPVAGSTRVGNGSYVNAGCVVGGGGLIGAHTIINRGSGVGHHARIGAFVSIGPGVVLAGHVTVCDAALIGAGAVVLPRLRIGAGAVVGAGSVVTRDVPDHALVIGNPARFVRNVD